MHDVVFYVAVGWAAALLAAIAIVVGRASSALERVLAVDTMVLVAAAFMLVLAAGPGGVLFIDAAVVLALLSFTTTIALARYVADRGADT